MNGFSPHPEDFIVVLTLVLMEALLSADNALVLALQVKHLPESQQRRALLYGIFGAFALRGLGIFFAKSILGLWWLCAIGAGYLLWMSAHHFWSKRSERGKASGADTGEGPTPPRRRGLGFWQTVVLVEVTDIAFAVDSILVAVALSRKLWVIYLGVALGIVLLRLAASFFLRLIERYPALDMMAYALVGWAGVKLGAKALELYWESAGRYTPQTVPHVLPSSVFWTVMAIIVATGIWNARRCTPSK